MTRLEKHQLVEELAKVTASYACMVVVRQTRIDAEATSLLRKGAHEAGVLFRVVKNRLAKRALSHQPQEFGAVLSGPTAIFMSQDAVSLAKLLMDFSKKREDHFFPLAGTLDGSFLEGSEIAALASLPSLDQLRVQILGLINAPAVQLLSTIKEPSRGIACVLHSHSHKQQ